MVPDKCASGSDVLGVVAGAVAFVFFGVQACGVLAAVMRSCGCSGCHAGADRPGVAAPLRMLVRLCLTPCTRLQWG